MHRHLAWFFLSAILGMASAAEKPLADKPIRVPIGNPELTQTDRWREVRALITQAVDAGAPVLVFDINVTDAPGLTALPMAEEVARLKVRTIAYINSAAVGGGALLALGCDEIWMSPGSRIGAVPPSIAADKDTSTTVQETQLADALARLKGGARSLAKLKGHRADVAEAFVDRSLGFQLQNRTLAARGEPLLLDGDDAALQVEGKPLLAKGVAADLGSLAKTANLKGQVTLLTAELLRPPPPEPAKPADKQPLLSSPRTGSYTGKVVVIPVGKDDLLARARFEFMSRTLQRASDEAAEAVIFDLDTPGGLAWDTTDLMMRDLQRLKPRSFAFVNPRAISAGAMIAVATDAIYMTPASSVGAATPVVMGGTLDEPERAKMTSALVGMARTVASEKGHDPRVIEAMIDPRKQLVIDGEILFKDRKPLTLAAEEAIMVVNGRPLFAKAIVKTLDDVKAAEGLRGETIVAEPTAFEHVAIWVTNYAAILILIGLAGCYFELQAPGFGIPGFVSIAAFTLFFFGHYVAGSLVGQEALVAAALFITGMILLVLEFLVFPGTLLLGLVGFLCMTVALVYTMSAWEPAVAPGETAPSGFSLSVYALGLRNFALGIVGAGLLIALVARFLPESRLFRRLVLATSVGGAPDTVPQTVAAGRVSVGQQGRAVSALRPYGTVQFGDLRLEAVCEGGYLQAGADVRVREVRDTRIIVEPMGLNSVA